MKICVHSPVYDGLEIGVALLGDVWVACRSLLLPRELLSHSAARDDRHLQLRFPEPDLQLERDIPSTRDTCDHVGLSGKTVIAAQKNGKIEDDALYMEHIYTKIGTGARTHA